VIFKNLENIAKRKTIYGNSTFVVSFHNPKIKGVYSQEFMVDNKINIRKGSYFLDQLAKFMIKKSPLFLRNI